MKVLCIYHGNCADGFGAAWAVRHALGEGVEFHAGVYGNAPPDVRGRDVLLVDFCYNRPVLDKMIASARSLLILDHHKSAKEECAHLEEDLGEFFAAPPSSEWRRVLNAPGRPPLAAITAALFDMERSGAGIAWDYFHPDQSRPRLIDHIEDRDLWRFRLPFTREVQAALFSFVYDFAVWDRLMALDVEVLANEGAGIERKHHKDIAELVEVMQRPIMIGGIAMPVANLPYTLASDAGNLMAREADGVAACYWDTPEGRVFSLRSTDDGPDVSAIAKRYGGGGHAHAAGFRMPIGWEGDLIG
jgi:oligoribonuclease NrnB/cAMP/cGMP phosphodiesterase (DHH superfamily)